MGWISDLFGGGSSTPTTLVTSTASSVPGYVEDYSKSQLQLATALGNRPFEQFTGDRVAGFTSPQQQSFDIAQNNVGAWKPSTGVSQNVMQSQATGGWPTADMASYTNPYISTMNDAVNRAYDITGNQQNANAVGSGAFGGARQGVMTAENDRNRNTALADISRQGYEDAYTKWGGDQSRQMSAAQNLTTLADTQQRLGAADVASLAGIGGQQQGLAQLEMDSNRQMFGEQQQYPLDMFNLRQSALSGLPYSQTGTTTAQQPGVNTTAQTLGSLAGMVGGVGSFFATPTNGQSAATGLGNAWDTVRGWF